MNLIDKLEQHGLTHIVKDVFIFENKNNVKKDILPFFSDGFPGIVFQTGKKAVLKTSWMFQSVF